MKKQIAILGSTGSIGTQALQVVEEHPDLYEVYALTANNKVELLAEQARKFMPEAVLRSCWVCFTQTELGNHQKVRGMQFVPVCQSGRRLPHLQRGRNCSLCR